MFVYAAVIVATIILTTVAIIGVITVVVHVNILRKADLNQPPILNIIYVIVKYHHKMIQNVSVVLIIKLRVAGVH